MKNKKKSVEVHLKFNAEHLVNSVECRAWSDEIKTELKFNSTQCVWMRNGTTYHHKTPKETVKLGSDSTMARGYFVAYGTDKFHLTDGG